MTQKLRFLVQIATLFKLLHVQLLLHGLKPVYVLAKNPGPGWFFFKKKRDTYILVRSKRRKIYINPNTNKIGINNNVSAIQPNKK